MATPKKVGDGGYYYHCEKCLLTPKFLVVLWSNYQNRWSSKRRWMAHQLHLYCLDHAYDYKLNKEAELEAKTGSKNEMIRVLNKAETEELVFKYRTGVYIELYPLNIWEKPPAIARRIILAQVLSQKVLGYLPQADLEETISLSLAEYTVLSIDKSAFSLSPEDIDKMVKKPVDFKKAHPVSEKICPNCQEPLKENPDKKWCEEHRRQDFYCITINCPKFMKPEKVKRKKA